MNCENDDDSSEIDCGSVMVSDDHGVENANAVGIDCAIWMAIGDHAPDCGIYYASDGTESDGHRGPLGNPREPHRDSYRNRDGHHRPGHPGKSQCLVDQQRHGRADCEIENVSAETVSDDRLWLA